MKKILLCCMLSLVVIFSEKLGYTLDFYTYTTDHGNFAVSTKASTLGLGIEGITRINSRLNARLGVNAFEYDYSDIKSNIKYNLELQLRAVSALLDWHPLGGVFRISAGGIYNENKIEMKAKTASTYSIGNITYTSDEIGTLTGEFDVNNMCPYLGIGWGNALSKNQKWTFVVDIGAMYHGKPQIDLATTGTFKDDSILQYNLLLEKDDLEDNIEEFKFYPVISFGVCYSF